MATPGSNLLNRALSRIAAQQITYFKFNGTTVNSVGVMNTDYAVPRIIAGSVQPVPRALYDKYGLLFDKNYVTIYVSKNALDVAADIAGDQFAYNGKRYQAESKTDWFAQDGWDAILCVQVGDAC